VRYEPSLIGAKSRPYLPELPVRPSVSAAVVVVGVDVWGGCEGRRMNRRLDEADEVTWVSAIDFELRQDSLAPEHRSTQLPQTHYGYQHMDRIKDVRALVYPLSMDMDLTR